MSVSDHFLAYAIDQLAPFSRVSSRRMFGGVGLYADDVFFGLIADNTLYFKVDDSNRADYEARGLRPFRPFPDKSEYSMSYYEVSEELLEDSDALASWARKALAAAKAVAQKKPKTKAKSARSKLR